MGILCVETAEEANEGLYFSWCLSLLPSSYYFVCALYLALSIRGRALLVFNYSSIRVGSYDFFCCVTLDWDCSDSQVQLQGYRNKLKAVQVPNIHSAGCSLYCWVAIIYSILGGAHTNNNNLFFSWLRIDKSFNYLSCRCIAIFFMCSTDWI